MQCGVDFPDNHRRRVKGVQRAGAGGLKFSSRQQPGQLGISRMPLGIVRVKHLRQTAPTHIPGQNALLLCGGKAVFLLNGLQSADGGYVGCVFGPRTAGGRLVRLNVIGQALVGGNFRVQNVILHPGAVLWFGFRRRSKSRLLFRLFFRFGVQAFHDNVIGQARLPGGKCDGVPGVFCVAVQRFWCCQVAVFRVGGHQPGKFAAAHGAADEGFALLMEPDVRQPDVLHRKRLVIFQIDGIPHTQRAERLFRFGMRLLVEIFGGGNHRIEIQIAELAVQILRRITDDFHDGFIVNLIHQLSLDQVGKDLNGMFVIGCGAEREIHMVQIGEICVAVKLRLTVFVDQPDGLLDLSGQFRSLGFLGRTPQAVIERIFPQPALKFFAGQFGIHQRKGLIVQAHDVPDAGYGVCVTANVNGIPKRIGVFRCGGFFPGPVFPVLALLLGGQVTVCGNQFANSLGGFGPAQLAGRLPEIFAKQNPFAVIGQIPIFHDGKPPADPIFLFQKGGVFCGGGVLLELLINAQLAFRKSAAVQQYLVDHLLRHNKSGGLFILRLLDLFFLVGFTQQQIRSLKITSSAACRMLFIRRVHAIGSRAFRLSVTPCFCAICCVRFRIISLACSCTRIRCGISWPLACIVRYSGRLFSFRYSRRCIAYLPSVGWFSIVRSGSRYSPCFVYVSSMVLAPFFGWVRFLVPIICHNGSFCKCADSLFLRRPHSGLDFPQPHPGNVADGGSQQGRCFRRAEHRQILPAIVQQAGAVDSGALPQHRCDGALHQMGVYAVQILRRIPRQQGARSTRGKLVTVIRQVFGGQYNGGIRKDLRKGMVCGVCAVGVSQRFPHCGNVLLRQFPQPGRVSLGTVGVGHIKHIPQTWAAAGSIQKRNAAGASVDPPPDFVPCLHLCAGDGIWPLCVNEQNVLKRIFVMAGYAAQIPAPRRHIPHHLFQRVALKLFQRLLFVGQTRSLLSGLSLLPVFLGTGRTE